MRIYTKRGDEGQTDLIGGPRVPKDHARVAAYGAVDELNAALGLAAAPAGGAVAPAWCAEIVGPVQEALFELGADLATPHDESNAGREQASRLSEDDVGAIESHIDRLQGELSPLRTFILPGGGERASRLHVARTVCRRAERDVVQLAHAEPVAAIAVRYLNRVSDLLFVMARYANHDEGLEDEAWLPRDK